MKPMSLLLCGIVVSSLAAPLLAQQHQQGWNWPPDRPTAIETRQQNDHPHDFTPPAPRGDLRGDIASNVRTRPEPNRDESPRRH
ncbi:hypothetical protein [Paraburkholderia sp.]|uniref:hypothetical protein n=1 Tax=Paraburkholderia sp. TaxID=1926495 RepID=UPI0023929A6A|nr:hypothetical protein [Paraburkholderia sp.]MDE1184612.1 hypothetical protein [Paraburkholderia sp.]